MSVAFACNQQFSLAGKTFNHTRTISAKRAIVAEESVPAAKAGTLTTRTDNDTGQVTLGAGHGIITGDRIDVYWSGGSRRGITAGTVAGNVVPIDVGAGDNLPIATTVVQVCKAVEAELRFDGADARAIVVFAEAKGIIIFAGDDDVEDWSVILPIANQVGQWMENDVTANPVTGDSITKVFFSHADTTGAKTMRVGVAA